MPKAVLFGRVHLLCILAHTGSRKGLCQQNKIKATNFDRDLVNLAKFDAAYNNFLYAA
jgi:hypothetical protein